MQKIYYWYSWIKSKFDFIRYLISFETSKSTSRCLDYIWYSVDSLQPTSVLETVGVPEGIQWWMVIRWGKKTGTKIKKKIDQVHLVCRTQFVDLHSRNIKKRTINDQKSTREYHKLPNLLKSTREVTRNDLKVPQNLRNYQKYQKYQVLPRRTKITGL